jgi:metal-sulfur cluster biosynthetic enzyme
MITKKVLMDKLKDIPDPELGISIVDLGLVYDVKWNTKGVVTVIMTLTTMGCPLFDQMADPIRQEIAKVKGVKRVEVELTFDPPWSMEKMSKEAKIKLGFF